MNLSEADRDFIYHDVLPEWIKRRVRAGLPVEAAERMLKMDTQSWGGTTSVADGPYSDGENAEHWSLHYARETRGFAIAVVHTVRATGQETTLRSGVVTWRELSERVLAEVSKGQPGEQLSF